jgi:hypothetical protein
MINRRMKLVRRRLGLDDGHTLLRTDRFRPPAADGRQLSLL